jgi:DNA-binding winged helix-turn-helix (wHTH) protein/Tfp pilus assembly protein PilF
MIEAPIRALRFDPFELDLSTLELRRSGRLVRLQHQPARVLALLARRAGEAVAREEIRREVWGTDTFVDFEHGLNFCIRQVRAALEDDAAAPRFVETLPRRGYRFIAPVETTNGRPGPEATQPRRSRSLFVATLAGLALLGLAVPFVARHGGPRPPAPSPRPEAQDAYLKARYLLARGGEDSLRRAIGFLEQARSADPRFAAAHTALAEAWVALGDRGLAPASEAYPAARGAAETALALDPRSAEAWVYLGVVQTYFEWDLASGPKAFDRAIALSPNLAIAHHYSADYLAAVGRKDEAVAAVRRAQALDPLSPAINEDVGWYAFFAGRYLEAAQQFRRAADLQPRTFLPHVYAAYAYAALQDWPQALAAAGTAMRESGTAPAEVERALGSGGRGAYVGFLRRALAWQQQRTGACFCFALRAELEDGQGALDDLERARDARWRYLLVEVGADPRLARLHGEPRFQAIERQLGLRRSPVS